MADTTASSTGARSAPELTVRVRNGCRRWLLWECELPDGADVRLLPASLGTLGFTNVSHFDRVAELVDSTGNAVVVVPSTGRVQIRVHYLTHQSQRQGAARRIASLIRKACTD